MGAVAFWSSLALACGLLARPLTRNAGWFGLVGTILGGFYHFNLADIPDVQNYSFNLWTFALYLAASRQFPRFEAWSVRVVSRVISFVFSLGPGRRAKI